MCTDGRQLGSRPERCSGAAVAVQHARMSGSTRAMQPTHCKRTLSAARVTALVDGSCSSKRTEAAEAAKVGRRYENWNLLLNLSAI